MAIIFRKMFRGLALALSMAVTAYGLSACSSKNDPLIAQTSSLTELSTTGSVASSQEVSDQQAIKGALLAAAKNDVQTDESLALAWSNKETGNSGTITAIEKQISGEGATCYRFLTTLETYTGISLYDAQTCELATGQWVMSFFRSKQAA